MKKLLPAFCALFLLLLTAPEVWAQNQQLDAQGHWNYQGKSTKFAMSVSKVVHIEAAIATAKMMQVKKNHYQFEIVMAGPAAKAIVEDPDQKKFIDEAQELGVKMTVCGYALNKMGIDPQKVDKRIQITPNAAIYMFELHDMGYNTL